MEIKKLKREIYNCCKTKQSLCRICFDKYHIAEELEEELNNAQTKENELVNKK